MKVDGEIVCGIEFLCALTEGFTAVADVAGDVVLGNFGGANMLVKLGLFWQAIPFGP